MNLRELKGRLGYWQERMNLREWRVTLRWGTGRECPESGPIVGCCNWNAEELTANIYITRRSPLPEETLVHELLHIVFQGHCSETPGYDVHLERALNRTAAALLRGDIA